MTLLAAMERNRTVTRLVLPTSVNKNEMIIKSKLDKINKERIKNNADTLVLDVRAT